MIDEELCTLIQELIGRGRWLEREYNRHKISDEQAAKEIILSQWQSGYRDWEIAKINHWTDEDVQSILTKCGIRYQSRYTKNDEYIKKLSNEYLMFNGAFLLNEILYDNKLDPEIVATGAGIPRTTFNKILGARLIPTKDQLLNLVDLLKIDLHKWALLSSDVQAIIDGSLLDDVPRTMMFKQKYIGTYEKKIRIHPILAYGRLYKFLSFRDMAKLMKVLDWQYLDIEQSLSVPSIDQAKIAGKVLGLKYWQDIFIVDVAPVNYEYVYKNLILKELHDIREYYQGRKGGKFMEQYLTNPEYAVNDLSTIERCVVNA